TADGQCVSGSCNTRVARCASIAFGTCQATIGCAPDAAGDRFTCLSVTQPTCEKIGDGSPGSVCGAGTDCQSNMCERQFCRPPLISCSADYPDCTMRGFEICESSFCTHPIGARCAGTWDWCPLGATSVDCRLTGAYCMESFHSNECLFPCRAGTFA